MLRSVPSLALIVTLAAGTATAGQEARSFTKTVEKKLSLQYLLSLPDGYSKTGPAVPLVLYLHGAGARGADLEALKRKGPPKLVEAGKALPAILVSPQCPKNEVWNERVDSLLALLDEVQSQHAVDANRIYVIGHSMGGYGAWALASRAPDRFAAAVPICGGGIDAWSRRLREMPIWAFHGDADSVVPVDETRRMSRALERVGNASARETIYPGVGHDSWTATYDDPKVWTWLFAQSRSAP